MEDLNKYIGKKVRSLPNDLICPEGIFKCISARMGPNGIILTLNCGYQTYPEFVEIIDSKSKNARILTEKVMIDGIKCRKILGFENIINFGGLPDLYRDNYPRFSLILNDDACIVVLNRNIHWSLHIGDTIRETQWKHIVPVLKEAGSRLAKINKELRDQKLKSEWLGEDIIEI